MVGKGKMTRFRIFLNRKYSFTGHNKTSNIPRGSPVFLVICFTYFLGEREELRDLNGKRKICRQKKQRISGAFDIQRLHSYA